VGNKAAQVRVGKFKMPFSLEQLTSSNNMDFMERSLVGNDDKELIPGKQYGAMLFGSPIDGASYALALSKGNNTEVSNSTAPTTGNSEFIGRLAANVSKLAGNADSVVHLGVGYSAGKLDTASSFGSGTEGRGISALINENTAVTVAGASRSRYNIEGALVYGPFKVQSEFFEFHYEKDSNKQAVTGHYVSALWNITGESHNYSNSSNTFGWIKPKESFSTAKGGLGAWQVGLRISEIGTDYATLSTSAGLDTSTTKANATTLGLTWFANSNVRFMLNYVKTDFAETVRNTLSETAINARAQVSF
jgi:phosphate-selective porin OprO/OprP